MPTYPFLSDEWFAAVDELVRGEGLAPPEGDEMVVNATVTDRPGADDRELHVGTRDGAFVWGAGHVEGADLTIVTNDTTARELFFGADPQAVLSAFLVGKLIVSGDIGKLVERVQVGTPGASPLPIPAGLVDRVHALTA
jgi:hypothetical protein